MGVLLLELTTRARTEVGTCAFSAELSATCASTGTSTCKSTTLIHVSVYFQFIADWGLLQAVVVSGCDTGFGRTLALKLDALGYKVFAGCITEKGKDTLSCQNQFPRENAEHAPYSWLQSSLFTRSWPLF